MNRKGVCYDVGKFFLPERSTRPIFDRDAVRREMTILRNDLHCNAVRISGYDIDRLTFAAETAAENGLEVWFSPSIIDSDEVTTLAYLTECAGAAEALRQKYSDVVFLVGCEWSLFSRGILAGNSFMERIKSLSDPSFWGSGGMTRVAPLLNQRLAAAAQTVRMGFHGPLSYASGTWEPVDWTPFDFVGIDHYRDSGNAPIYVDELRRSFSAGKPVVITEFGCCTYRGAQDRGGMGWAIIDWTKSPPEFAGHFERDEQVQVDYILDLLTIFEAENVNGAFVFTFLMPQSENDGRRVDDFDLASYNIVKSLGGRSGLAYPGLPWEPKAVFFAIAKRFAAL